MKKITAALMVGLTLSLGLPALAAEQPSQNQTQQTAEQPTASMTLPKDLLVPEFWGVDLPGDKEGFSIHEIFETFDGDIQVDYINSGDTYPYQGKIFSLRQNKVVREWQVWQPYNKVENEKYLQSFSDYMHKNEKVEYKVVDKLKLENGLMLDSRDGEPRHDCYNFRNHIALMDAKGNDLKAMTLTFFYDKPIKRITNCAFLEEDEGSGEINVMMRTPFVTFYPLPDGTYLIWDYEHSSLVRFYGILQSPLDPKKTSWIVMEQDFIFDFYYKTLSEIQNCCGKTPKALELADNVVYLLLKSLKNKSPQPKL